MKDWAVPPSTRRIHTPKGPRPIRKDDVEFSLDYPVVEWVIEEMCVLHISRELHTDELDVIYKGDVTVPEKLAMVFKKTGTAWVITTGNASVLRISTDAEDKRVVVDIAIEIKDVDVITGAVELEDQ